ncbi:MAG: pilin [Candidatus Gracilibacteria bacterium]
MKKLAILILSSFISATMLSYFVGVAFAETEQPTLQIYYSESLGTGEKVMHITACRKEPAMGVVTCTKEAFNAGFGKQCEKEGDISNTIQGCLIKPGANGDEYERISDTSSYPKVDISKYALNEEEGGCKDKPENRAPLYGKRYGLISKLRNENPDPPITEADIQSEFVQPDDVQITRPEGYVMKPMYEPTLCASWDKVVDSAGGVSEDTTLTEEQKKNIEALKVRIAEASADAEARFGTQDNCNGTEHGDKLDSAPMISCTILERVTGKSGTEILSKYMKTIYSWASGLVGIIAVLTMVYSGIQISMAGGDSAKIDSAKTRITQSIVGIVILFLSGLILYTINPTFFTG